MVPTAVGVVAKPCTNTDTCDETEGGPTGAILRGSARQGLTGLVMLVVVALIMVFSSGLATASAPAPAHASAIPSVLYQVVPKLSPALPSGAVKGLDVASSTPVTFTFEFAVPPSAAETAYLDGLYTLGSPYYHHFLLDDGFYTVFGPSSARTSAFLSYLHSDGLMVLPGGGPWLYTVSGPASSAEAVFHTTLAEYTVAGTTKMAPSSPLAVPSQFNGLIDTVTGLNQFAIPHPTYKEASSLSPSAAASPSIFQTFYNASTLISGGDTGSKYAIGLAEMCDSSVASTSYQTEVNDFDSANSLPAITLNMMLDTGASTCSSGTNGGWSTETNLDIQSSHSLATGETLYVCLDNSDPDTCDQNFVNDQTSDNIQIGSNSFGGGSDDQSVWKSAYAAGITLFASAGDSCEQVNYPAADIYGAGVGGTTMSWGTGGTFSSETVWSCSGGEGTGGGCDTNDAPQSWQIGMTGYPGTTCTSSERGVPDVGMDANPSSGLNIYASGCSPCQYGGTSLASPLWAASLDLIESSVGAYAFAVPTIYSIAKSANYDLAFHDITSGSNGIAATVGWDPDTGVGSPNIGELAALWKSSSNGTSTYSVTFDTSPTTCSITFNGTSYANGQVKSGVTAGSYPITANACTGEIFSAWTSTAGTVTSTTSSSTTITVSSSGTLTATYTAAPTYPVTFDTVPSTCTISFNGVTYANGAVDSTATAGNATLVANTCAGETFVSWTSTAGTLASTVLASTTVDILSAGTITATYTATTYPITLDSSPSSCAPVTFDGTPYAQGGVASVIAGSYSLAANTACNGYNFEKWTTSGTIALVSTTAATTSATVSATATVTAVYTVITYPVDFAVTPSACATSTTQITFGTNTYVNGGSDTVAAGSYPLSAGTCAGYHFGSWSVSPSSAFTLTNNGTASTTVQVINTGTITAQYITNDFAVIVDVAPSSCGQVSVGGTGYGNGATAELAAGSYTLSAPSCSGYYSPPTYSTSGSTLKVATSGGVSTLTVSAAGTLTATYPTVLGASITVPSSGAVGATISVSVSISWGLKPYSVTWNFGNGNGATDSQISGSTDTEQTGYTADGTYSVSAVVTDSSGQSTTVSGSISIGSSSGGGGGGSPTASLLSGDNLLYLAIAVVVLVAIIAAVALARRRKEPPSSGPYGGEEGYYQQDAYGGYPAQGGYPPQAGYGGAPPGAPPPY